MNFLPRYQRRSKGGARGDKEGPGGAISWYVMRRRHMENT